MELCYQCHFRISLMIVWIIFTALSVIAAASLAMNYYHNSVTYEVEKNEPSFNTTSPVLFFCDYAHVGNLP